MIDNDEKLTLKFDKNLEKWCKNNKIRLTIAGDTMYIRFEDYLKYKRGQKWKL